MTIKEIQEQIEVLEGQIELWRLRLVKAVEAEFGLSGFTIVRASDKEYRYKHLYQSRWTLGRKPWIYGVLKKKNGEFSDHTTLLYNDWTIVQIPDKPDAR